MAVFRASTQYEGGREA
uniref:Uncharacterized protein n=1 Tax=Arundo donax TaxID=35708 RepID=A0A0A9AW91_ARUDO